MGDIVPGGMYKSDHSGFRATDFAVRFLETDLEKLRAAASTGYARGKVLPRDRKDWYD